MEQEKPLKITSQNISAKIAGSVTGINKNDFQERLETLTEAAQDEYNKSDGIKKVVAAVDLLNMSVAKRTSQLSPNLVGATVYYYLYLQFS